MTCDECLYGLSAIHQALRIVHMCKDHWHSGSVWKLYAMPFHLIKTTRKKRNEI